MKYYIKYIIENIFRTSFYVRDYLNPNPIGHKFWVKPLSITDHLIV